MNRGRLRAATASAAALALALCTAATALPAAAIEETEWVAAGQLALKTGAVDRVEYPYNDPTPATQTLGKSGSCTLSTSGSDLLQFSGLVGSTKKSVGFLNDSIGVVETSLASLCYRVDNISWNSSETLQVKLGSDLKSFAGQSLLANKAALDLEVRSSFGAKAKITATAKLALPGNPTIEVGTAELAQGSAACNVVDGRNCTWGLNFGGKRFNELTLKATQGSFSLEGGSDTGEVPAPPVTTFDLVSEVDEVLDCSNDSNTLAEGNATVTYIGNASGGCTPVGVVLNAGATSVEFRKPLDIAPDAQFIVDIDWLLPAPASPTAVDLPPVYIDFLVPGGVCTTNQNLPGCSLPFCVSSVYDDDGKVAGISDPEVELDGLDFEPTALDGIQYACIGHRTAEVAPTSLLVKDKIFLIGDPRMRL